MNEIKRINKEGLNYFNYPHLADPNESRDPSKDQNEQAEEPWQGEQHPQILKMIFFPNVFQSVPKKFFLSFQQHLLSHSLDDGANIADDALRAVVKLKHLIIFSHPV